MGDNSMRRVGLQPQKCRAKAKSTGRPCGQWAVVGSTVCYSHGGGRGDVRANGELRAVAAQIGAVGLPPDQTIKLVQRALSDQMLRAAGVLQAAAAENRPVDPAEYERFESVADKAMIAARVALQSGVEDQDAADAVENENRQLVADALMWTIDAVLKLLEVPGTQRLQVREFAIRMSIWALEGGDPTKRPEEPKLLPDTVAVAELLPAPARRRQPDAADDVWRRAQTIVDAEVVEDDGGDDGGDDEDDDRPTVA